MINTTFKRLLRTKNAQLSRAFAKKTFGKQKPLHEYNPVEFEPFKFQYEREELFKGFTQDELFQRDFGERHSNQVRRDMSLDSFIAISIFVASAIFGVLKKDSIFEFELAWDEYYQARKDEAERVF